MDLAPVAVRVIDVASRDGHVVADRATGAAVAVITPATTSAATETIATTPKGTGHATGQLGKKHLGKRTYGNNYSGFRETPPPGYYGNWNFAPGGDYWDRNYLWRRSLGFWDTNSPACPFRSC